MAMVPMEDLPPEVRRAVTPDSPMFKAYALDLEQRAGMPPGSLSSAKFELQPGTDALRALQVAALNRMVPDVANPRAVPPEDLPPAYAQAAGAPAGGTQGGVRTTSPAPLVNPAKGDYSGVGPFGLNLSQDAGNLAATTGRVASEAVKGLTQFFTSAPTQATDAVKAEALSTQKKLGVDPDSIDESRRLDAPLLATPEGMAGTVLGNVALTAIPAEKLADAANAARTATRMGTTAGKFLRYVPKGPLAQAAAVGATDAAIQPVASDESRLGNAAEGGAAGLLGGAAVHSATALARPAAESATAAKAYLAAQAQKYGIPLRAAQISDNPWLKWAQPIIDAMPWSGAGNLTAEQHKAFNKVLARSMGQDTDNATTAISTAHKDLSTTYDNLKAGNTLQIEPWHMDAFNDINNNFAPRDVTPGKSNLAQLKAFQNSVADSTDPSGMMSGTTYKSLRSQLGDYSRGATDSTYQQALDSYQSVLDKAFKSGLSPQNAQLLDLTDKQWANKKLLTDIAPLDGSGDFDFAKLASRYAQKNNANAGNRAAFTYGSSDGTAQAPFLPDVARIGTEFLKRGTGSPANATLPAWAFAKQMGKQAIAPGAMLGGLYALNHGDEDPITTSALELLGMFAAGKGLGLTTNSGAFMRGMPNLANIAEGARVMNMPQVPTGMLENMKSQVTPDPYAAQRGQ